MNLYRETPLSDPPLSPEVPSVAPPAPNVYPVFAGYGIESEYMIVDRDSLDVRPLADELLRAAAGEDASDVPRGPMGWSNELALHVFEIKNRVPQAGLEGLAANLQAEVRAANALLAPVSARLMPGGMHPWMDPAKEARLWSRQQAELYAAYDRIFDCRRHGWVNIQSIHLNLPFGNDLEFARLHAAARLVLPLLPALAASSPFAEGRFTGFMDYRLEVYRSHQMRVPATMGVVIPDSIASPADYRAQVLLPMYRQIAPHDPEGLLQHEWLNARGLIPRFERSALEIRLLDTQECPLADCAIVAAVTALVRRFYSAGAAWLDRQGKMETRALADILLACIRDAEQAVVDDLDYIAVLGLERRSWQAREIWAWLLNDMVAHGELSQAWIKPLRFILEQGPLARRLVDAVGPNPSRRRLQAVYGELARCLQEGRMYLS
ncbi:MAG: hypothetical protein H6R10_1581 [Rhodocyclaceae bacterium]|nr:hypothetical protein [Rhodocyclaceae bacterium]